jgi:hypothetical protein
MERILELEATDDITSIRSRIEYVLPELVASATAPGQSGQRETRRLLLTVPRQNKAMQSLVNMKLLARLVKSRAVELAIVSNHPTVRDFAREAEVKAYGSVGSARRAGWLKSKSPVTPETETLPPVLAPISGGEEAGSEEKSAASTKKAARKPKPKKKYVLVLGSGRVGCLQQFGALALVLVLSAMLVVGVIALLPQATVTLVPVAEPVETELIVRADPDADSVDFQELTFPARVTQVELALSGQIETIKTELAPVGYAEGTVTFINRTEEEQIIPISVTVSTSAGEPVEFLTTVTATIPAGIGALTPTQVIAVEPGPLGNAAAGQINRFVNPSFGLLARVINEAPLSGGTMEPARVVEQADKERLQAHLRQLVYQEGLNQLEELLVEQEFISPETLQVIVLDVTYNEFAGDVSNTFSGEMQAVVRGTVVGGYNANRLALAALELQVPPGYELDLEGLHFGAGEILDVQDGMIIFKIFARGRAVPIIDPHGVAEEIAWLPVGEAQALLSQQYELATVPAVDLKPDWVVEYLGRLPFSPLRIGVNVGEAVTPVAEER